jgi:hypothetical protein
VVRVTGIEQGTQGGCLDALSAPLNDIRRQHV